MNSQFSEYSIFLPFIEERQSLLETVIIIESTVQQPHHYILVTTEEKNRDEVMQLLQGLPLHPSLFSCIIQSQTGISSAFQDAIQICRSKYLILMASDLETDPALVASLIRSSQLNPASIIQVSRWLRSQSFYGYGKGRQFANWLFQKLSFLLIGAQITDYTFAFRLYPTRILKDCLFRQRGHAVFLESLLVPLSKGETIFEIPGNWRSRHEGFSKKRGLDNLRYLQLLLANSRIGQWLINILSQRP